MPQSDSRSDSRLAAVDSTLREIEVLCGRMERALQKRDWSEIDAAIADARRVTHALQNAMDDAAPVRNASFDEQIFQRLRYVGAIRENQMKRIEQYRDAVSERLHLLARWRSAIRSLAHRATVGSSLNDVR